MPKMNLLHFNHNHLFFDGLDLALLAQNYGTPCYVYAQKQLKANIQAFETAFENMSHQTFFALKANANPTLLESIVNANLGVDIVSAGELYRALKTKVTPEKIIFSGVGKTAREIHLALEKNIHCINAESVQELTRINHLAKQVPKIANIALRLNPNICANTHRFITTGTKQDKFGIDFEQALAFIETKQDYQHLKLIGIACHIGSQITTLAPFKKMITKMVDFANRLYEKNILLEHLNIGGGLGIAYRPKEVVPTFSEYQNIIQTALDQLAYRVKLFLEPGRAIIGNTGLLLTQIEYLKHTQGQHFAILNAGMSDFLRPALYQAFHEILTVQKHLDVPLKKYDIVGPICETADCFAKKVPLSVLQGDYLAILNTGAYGYSMSNQYNLRPQPTELLIANNRVSVIQDSIHP